MRHWGQLSHRTRLTLALIALAVDLLAFLGLDTGIGPRPLWSQIEDDSFALVGGCLLALMIVVIAFYLIEIARDLLRWKQKSQPPQLPRQDRVISEDSLRE